MCSIISEDMEWLTPNFTADQPSSIHEKVEKNQLYNTTSDCTVGTGREPKEFKEADNQLILLALVWKHQPKKISHGI